MRKFDECFSVHRCIVHPAIIGIHKYCNIEKNITTNLLKALVNMRRVVILAYVATSKTLKTDKPTGLVVIFYYYYIIWNANNNWIFNKAHK